MDPVVSGADATTPLEAFRNITSPTGGDSRLDNLNVFYNVSLRPPFGQNLGVRRWTRG